MRRVNGHLLLPSIEWLGVPIEPCALCGAPDGEARSAPCGSSGARWYELLPYYIADYLGTLFSVVMSPIVWLWPRSERRDPDEEREHLIRRFAPAFAGRYDAAAIASMRRTRAVAYAYVLYPEALRQSEELFAGLGPVDWRYVGVAADQRTVWRAPGLGDVDLHAALLSWSGALADTARREAEVTLALEPWNIGTAGSVDPLGAPLHTVLVKLALLPAGGEGGLSADVAVALPPRTAGAA